MNKTFRLGLACWLLLSYSGLAQSERGSKTISDDKIVHEVSRLLRWDWYWEAHPLQNYVPGKKVELAIVEAPDEIATFLQQGLSVRFNFDGRSFGHGNLGTYFYMTNSFNVDRYITEYGRKAGFEAIPKDGGYEAGSLRSGDTLTLEQKRKLLKIHSISFMLPRLTPPEYILHHLRSPEMPHLKTAVPAALGTWYTPDCGKGALLIPYFSDDDPWVDVYADLGDCGKGIIYFTHHDGAGSWEYSQFSPNRPPNDFSSIIQKIRQNVADTVQLPGKPN